MQSASNPPYTLLANRARARVPFLCIRSIIILSHHMTHIITGILCINI